MLCSPGHCQWLGFLLGSRSGSVRLQSSILVRSFVNIIVVSNLVNITLRLLVNIMVSILVNILVRSLVNIIILTKLSTVQSRSHSAYSATT